jgi:hypothetical protein
MLRIASLPALFRLERLADEIEPEKFFLIECDFLKFYPILLDTAEYKAELRLTKLTVNYDFFPSVTVLLRG